MSLLILLQQRGVEDSITADAVLQETLSASLSADSILKKSIAASIVADSILSSTGISASFTADAWLARSKITGITKDNNGAVLASCEVAAFSQDWNTKYDSVTSDASDGSFTLWTDVAVGTQLVVSAFKLNVDGTIDYAGGEVATTEAP